MSTNLMQAANEWQSRPADERFENLADLYGHVFGSAIRAKQTTVATSNLRAKQVGENSIHLVSGDHEFNFNHWSFGQTARKVGVPSDFLRKIPAELAVRNLNWGFEAADGDDSTQLWYDGTTNRLRAATGDGYARIKNHEVVKAVIDLGDEWCTPPARPAKEGQPGARPATEADITGSNHPSLGIKVGDLIAPAGIYGGDRNIFVFRVNPTMRLDDGTDGGLGRGFFVRNSEVGDASFELVTFWYRYVCGNHIVWGAEQVVERRWKHVGQARGRAFDALRLDLDAMAKTDLLVEEKFIKAAKELELGNSQEEVVKLVFGKKKLVTKRVAEAAYLTAEQHRDTDGSPRTAWGYAQGITRLSQSAKYADERTNLDRAAGEVLALAGSQN